MIEEVKQRSKASKSPQNYPLSSGMCTSATRVVRHFRLHTFQTSILRRAHAPQLEKRNLSRPCVNSHVQYFSHRTSTFFTSYHQKFQSLGKREVVIYTAPLSLHSFPNNHSFVKSFHKQNINKLTKIFFVQFGKTFSI